MSNCNSNSTKLKVGVTEDVESLCPSIEFVLQRLRSFSGVSDNSQNRMLILILKK